MSLRICDPGAFPQLRRCLLSGSERKTIIDRLSGVKIYHNVTLGIICVKGGLVVGIQLAKGPNHIVASVQEDLLIAVVRWNVKGKYIKMSYSN